MTAWTSYKALSPKYKAAFGAGLLVWGFVGLRTTDKAEETLGLVPSEQDKAALERLKPKVVVIDRADFPSPRETK